MKERPRSENDQIKIYKFDMDKFFDYIKQQQVECAKDLYAFCRDRLVELYYGVVFQGEGNVPLTLNNISQNNCTVLVDIIKCLCTLDDTKR